jgi:adenylate cyclase
VNRRARRLRTTLLLAAALVVVGGAVALEATNALQRLEYATVNKRFDVRGRQPAPSNVVVVAIDDKTFEELDVRWPFRRKYHAQVIRNLTHAGAKVIAYDVQITEPQGDTKQDTEDDNALIEAVRDHPLTVMAD